MEFKAEFTLHLQRTADYKNNKTKSFAHLWEHCSSGMQSKIESRNDYTSTIKNNPIELLKAIKQHALNYQENHYDMSIIFNAMKRLMNLKQDKNESLQAYTKKFKAARDVLVQHIGGPLILTKIVEAMDDYDATDAANVKEHQELAWKRLIAYIYMVNADKDKYGSLLDTVFTQHNLKNNQYPKNLTDMMQTLSNHPWDKPVKTPPGGGNNNRTNNNNNDWSQAEQEPLTLSFAQLEGRCHCCGKYGHQSEKCYKKDTIPLEQWAINKTINKAKQESQQQAQSHLSTGTTTGPPSQVGGGNSGDNVSIAGTAATGQSPSQGGVPGWGSAQFQMNQSTSFLNLKEETIIDSASTVSLFGNPELVTDIRPTEKALQLGMNGGEFHANMEATVPNYPGQVWFDQKSLANIYSLAQMSEHYRVTMDTAKENTFIVHGPNGEQTKFVKTPEGLYSFKPTYRTGSQAPKNVNFIETVEENRAYYTDRQFQRAKRARELYQAIGSPSIRDFKNLI